MRRVAGLSNHFMARNFTACKEKRNQNYFDFGSKVIPHPEKVHKGGEDAYFANENVLAVADGVGGWADYGVDPALYSKELCKHLESLVKLEWNKYKTSPKQLLIDSAKKTKNKGSSTLCILNLDEEKPLLYTSYIGDSGYLVLRKVQNSLKVIYQSQDHQRSFNFPYQVKTIDPIYLSQKIGTNGDNPNIALNHEHQIQNDDIVIVASDGLFDNLDENQIINIVTPFTESKDKGIDANKVATSIAETAYKYSLDRFYSSPFARKAKGNYILYHGGKSDDITVVVAQIKLISAATQSK